VENDQLRVEIPDVDSQVLGQMLDWMYTERAPRFRILTAARGLLAVADKYQIVEFKVLFTI
jgi:hypothetical protein